MPEQRTLTRRRFAGMAGTGTAAVLGAPAAAARQQPDFDGWLSETSNYTGVVDRTGRETVTVTVGAEGNGGPYAYAPAAVRVDPGTTVRWEWTGQGAHNVNAVRGADFTSGDPVGTTGVHFERTVEDSGVVKYQCDPHASLGMKGVLVVGDVALDGKYPRSTTVIGKAALGYLVFMVAAVLYFAFVSGRGDAGAVEETEE